MVPHGGSLDKLCAFDPYWCSLPHRVAVLVEVHDRWVSLGLLVVEAPGVLLLAPRARRLAKPRKAFNHSTASKVPFTS